MTDVTENSAEALQTNIVRSERTTEKEKDVDSETTEKTEDPEDSTKIKDRTMEDPTPRLQETRRERAEFREFQGLHVRSQPTTMRELKMRLLKRRVEH